MSSKALLESITDQGIKNINFFEGRLLSGRDLREQLKADKQHHRQLGRAIGAGVIEGLEVKIKSDGSGESCPELTVTKGTALNARGEVLDLPGNVDILLTRPLEVDVGEDSIFRDCHIPPTTSIPSGAGLFILVMSPVAEYSEKRAPKSGISEGGKVTGCGNRYIEEGVTFRLVELDYTKLDSNKISDATRELLKNELLSEDSLVNAAKLTPERLSKLRNVMAHLCFGTERLNSFARDPFAVKEGDSAFMNYSALDDLYDPDQDDLYAPKYIHDCDVPLALFYWTLYGIAFLDLWAVRRRPYELTPSSSWPTLISPRRLAEAEAMFFQFQEQIGQLISSHPDPVSIIAQDYFRYLPPAGFLPLRKGTSPGLVAINFFGSLPHRSAPHFSGSVEEFNQGTPQYIDGKIISSLLIESFSKVPINVTDFEMIWTYYPWQHIQAITEDTSNSHHLLFVTAHMPPAGIARFDIARWDYSNYSKC